MRCIVINLQRAQQRRRFMTAQFDTLGLDFEILPGTDWKNLTDADWALVDREARQREGRRPLSPGMVGCWLSHKKALERIAGGDDEMAAVFEDDVQLSPDIKRLLGIIEGWQKQPFDILFLNRMKKDTLIRRFIPLATADAPYQLGLFRYSDWGAMGYVITQSAAAKFLDFYPKIIHQFDHSLHSYWLHGLRTLNVNPPLVSHAYRLIPDETSILQEAPKPTHRKTVMGVLRRSAGSIIEAVRMFCRFRQLHRQIRAQVGGRRG